MFSVLSNNLLVKFLSSVFIKDLHVCIVLCDCVYVLRNILIVCDFKIIRPTVQTKDLRC